MEESDVAAITRRSIRKHFPLGTIMSSGYDNPITIHSADDNLFRAAWALIAETMCVTIELSRSTKEEISKIVSERNCCPVCANAHCMMQVLALEAELQKNPDKENQDEKIRNRQALEYAQCILTRMDKKSEKKMKVEKLEFSHLNDVGKAEVALVVMLFDHMNRVVSVIMGDEMSTAMFSVPRALAKRMEKPSIIRFMSKIMSPILSYSFKVKNDAGLSLSLFDNNNTIAKHRLPDHLYGLFLAGVERTNAVGRLWDWVKMFEKEHVKKHYIPKDMIAYLDREVEISLMTYEFSSPEKVFRWVETFVQEEVSDELERTKSRETVVVIITVLLLSTFAPRTAYQCSYWVELVDRVGANMARCIVMWWSLRTSLNNAIGFEKAA